MIHETNTYVGVSTGGGGETGWVMGGATAFDTQPFCVKGCSTVGVTTGNF